MALSLSNSVIVFASTSPEYLEESVESSPIIAGFDRQLLPFKENRQSTLQLRSYFFSRDFDVGKDAKDLAAGGWLDVVSSAWEGQIKFGVTAFTSQKLSADNSDNDTGLLQPGHEGYSGISQAYVSYAGSQLAVQVGRYALSLPYLNQSDSRMIPRTFEGAHSVYKVSETLSLAGGLLTQVKNRTSTGFDPLYEDAGLTNNRTVSGIGAVRTPASGNTMGLYYIHAPDYMDTLYLELGRPLWTNKRQRILFSGQYTQQRSVGSELDGEFDVRHLGASLSWRNDTYDLNVAYTYYPERDELRHPWGSVPGYTSAMIKDFDRPKERTWLVGGSVRLTRWGVKGLKLSARYAQGDTPDCGLLATPDQSEFDLNLDYKPNFLNGLQLRLRGAWVNQTNTCSATDARDVAEVRLILNYRFDL